MARQQEREHPAWGKRSVAAALLSIGYVALVAARHEARFGLSGFALCAAALALGWTAARVRPRPLAWATWAAGVVVAATIASDETTRAASVLGAIVSSAAGTVALGRIASLGGIARDRKRSPRVALALVGVLWAPAVLIVAESIAGRAGAPALSPWIVTAAASMVGLALVGLAGAQRLERRLELGVVERLDSFLSCAAGAGGLGAVLALAGAVSPATAACFSCAAIGVAACATSQRGDPVALWRGVRRAAAVATVAVVVTFAFGFLVFDYRVHERAIVFGIVLAAVLAGAELSTLSRAVRGETSRRLLAATTARDALRGRDADAALAAALHALRTAAPAPVAAEPPRASPELWTLDPIRLLRVDAAGYPHEEPASLPPELVVVAVAEPESTLRAEALEAIEVRRPDLRPLSQWMRDAHMATATLVARGGEIEGVLFLPSHDGAPPLTLEEARALRNLADDLAPLCHARAKLARSMTREQEARTSEGEATTRAERLEHQLARAAAHHALAATRLARPAAVGIYSARSRAAYDAVERLAKSNAPVVVVARSGVDPVPFLARAHLAGARGTAPLVLVDCTSTREHDLARWRDPVASPLALADAGVLVLLDAAALPIDVQRLIGQALAERRAPWERPDALDIVLALTTVSDPRELVECGRLDSLLASRAGGAIDDPVRLPGISERPEDIRAIVTDRLAREGLRVRGAPVGIDDGAFARLVDHAFDGEDAELAAIVQKLVARARGEVVREDDVRAVLSLEPRESEGLSRPRRA